MRRFAALAIVLVAACGPRAVLGHGATYASTPSGNAANTVTGGPSNYAIADGRGEMPRATKASALSTIPPPDESMLDTPIRIVSAPTPGVPSSGIAVASASSAGAAAPGGIVISRLPAPHRIAAAEAPAPRTIDDALSLVGHRDSRLPLAFALAVATSLRDGTTDSIAPSFADGPALVAWAREQGTFRIAGAPMAPGDLLVFDRAAANEPASLVGVALATDARGVTAFLYLARGVVRVGHLDPARPSLTRDREGRTVNSYLRHTSDYPPTGTKYLAGELLAGSIKLR